MTRPGPNPDALREGATMPASTGSFDGTWYVEKDCESSLLGLRVSELLHEEASEFQKITIYDTPFFGRVLALDGILNLTERDEFAYHEMLVHVPLCQLREPRSVLIVGGGDCGALREVLKHPQVRRVVLCELDERVTRVCAEHFDWVDPALADSRTVAVFDDGVRYVEKQRAAFDLVVLDSTDPSGAALGLFTRDFYGKVGRALRPGGIMTAQAESPHWDAAMIVAMREELRAAFRQTTGYLCCIPTYPSGCWHLAWAANDRAPDAYFDGPRAASLESSCLYYNPAVHHAAFALPAFARRIIELGENPFERYDDRVRAYLGGLDDPVGCGPER